MKLSSEENYQLALNACKRHADLLVWSMGYLESKFPLSNSSLKSLGNVDLAILDQFSARFSKLQDAMGAKLFPAVLELTREPGNLSVFIDKLNRLEKIGAIPSAEGWLELREMRNEFSHDYPEDPNIQASMLNKAFSLASELLGVLQQIEIFAEKYSH